MPSITLIPEDSRLTYFPVKRTEMEKFYKLAQTLYWLSSEIDMSYDAKDYIIVLTKDEKHYVQFVLAFFAASDTLVNVNIAKRFKEEIPIPEAIRFYNFQEVMEDIHSETYSLLILTIIPDEETRHKLMNAITTMPIITEMTKYITQCTNSDESLERRLLRMACVEGIFFTGCFAVIYWFKVRGLLKGLTQANEFIARDEALHTRFAAYMYTQCNGKLDHEEVYSIVHEATELAVKFMREALPIRLNGMNIDIMENYIRNQANNLLTLVGTPNLYATKKIPAMFDNFINVINKSNFFDKKVTEYSHAIIPDDGTINYNF